jgi:hypothetical protein
MPRTDENGNLEFHPAELPADYRPMKHPDCINCRYYHFGSRLPADYQPMKHPDNNSFIREVGPLKQSRRTCKICGEPFTLLGEYDPENPAHDLCDDCILKQPKNPDQRYPEKTTQMEMDAGIALDGADEP